MNLKELWDSLTPNQQKRFRIYFKKVKTKKVKTKKVKKLNLYINLQTNPISIQQVNIIEKRSMV